jgi:alpha-beta hydrolase superfamily lysophospholipase
VKRSRRLVVWSTLLAPVLAYLAITGVVAYRLSHRPRPVFAEPPPAGAIPIETLRLHTRDGETLGAWYVSGLPDRPVIIVLHGHGDSRTGSYGYLSTLSRLGFGVLSISQRAHGDSSGDLSDIGWSSRFDVECAVDWLAAQNPSRPIDVFGVSMGAASAIFAAKDLGHRVHAYVLESPYRDLETAVRIRLQEHLRPPLDRLALFGLELWAPAFVHLRLSAISPLERVRDIPADVPVLLIAGERDVAAPLVDIQAIAAAGGGHMRLVSFPNAGHCEAAKSDPRRYWQEVKQFLQEAR